MKSLQGMVSEIITVLWSCDVTEWENEFIKSIANQTEGAADVSQLSERQIAVIERIYKKHFA